MEIKKIYVNGGSQCIAAGFMWDKVKEVYKKYNTSIQNHLDFAYPNILAKKLNIEIINDGAPGGSITRMIRKTYEYIFNNNIENVLFILEVPPGWRDEFYSNEYKRYFNMTIGNILSPHDETDVANGNKKEDLISIHKNFTNYFYHFIDDKLHLEKMMLSLLGLLSYMKLNHINYFLIDTGDFHTYLQRRKQPTDYNFVWFSEKYEYPMWEWAEKEKQLIKHETNGESSDEHMGIEANKFVANKLYNILVNENKTSIS